MSSREDTPSPLPSNFSVKDELIGSIVESTSALIEAVEDLNFDEIPPEIPKKLLVCPLCGTIRKSDVVTIPEIKTVTVADKQTSKEMEDIIPNIIDGDILQDQEPDVAGASNRTEHRESKAKQAQQKSENAEHAVFESVDESALEALKRENRIMMLRKSLDNSIIDNLLLYANIIAKLMNIDKELDYVLDRFNEHKKFHLLLESLHKFDSNIQYNDDAFPEDAVNVFKCRSTIDVSAACGTSSKGTIQRNVPASDLQTICGKYINIFKRINERVTRYTTLFKDLSICHNLHETYNSSVNARINALVLNVDNYRGDCLARIKNILPALKLFEEYVERRIQDCNRVSSNYCELAKADLNDAENKDKAVIKYRHSLNVIEVVLARKKEYLEDCKYMDQKKEDMVKQSNSLEFWGPESSLMYNIDPNFIMTKTNSLIELNFKVFDSLRKIIADVQYIITLADSIAPPT